MPASRALARTGRATMVDFLAYSLAGRASSKRRPATSACRMSFVLHMRGQPLLQVGLRRRSLEDGKAIADAGVRAA
jgi:hypothetical protein